MSSLDDQSITHTWSFNTARAERERSTVSTLSRFLESQWVYPAVAGAMLLETYIFSLVNQHWADMPRLKKVAAVAASTAITVPILRRWKRVYDACTTGVEQSDEGAEDSSPATGYDNSGLGLKDE